MSRAVFIAQDGSARELEVPAGTSLMRAAVTGGVPGIVGECGGQAMCATCHVYVKTHEGADLPELSEDEDEMLDCTAEDRLDNSRLGCQLFGDPEIAVIEVVVPASQV